MSFEDSSSAFNGMARVISLRPTSWEVNYLDFLMNHREQIRHEFNSLLNENRVRGRMILHLQFLNVNHELNGMEKVDDFYFSSLPSDFIYDFDSWFDRHVNSLVSNIENFNRRCSNWTIFNVVEIEFPLVILPNLDGGCSFFAT